MAKIDLTVLVTGATDGIGKQTALELAQMGVSVILHGRNHDRVQDTLKEISDSTGNEYLDSVVADFSSLREVKEMADRVIREFRQLNVLINNAGTLTMQREMTGDGFEMNFQVNHLAPFLLTNRLMHLLKINAPARIITVSSDAHAMCELDFENLQAEKHFEWLNAYGISKLGNVFMTYELAERMAGTGVTTNCLHPGDIDTKMQRATSDVKGESTAKGAETSVFLATSPEVEGVTGKFFIDKKEIPSCEESYNIETRRRLWSISEGMLKDYLI